MSEWISVKRAYPHDGAIVICKGNPTLCCEEDMDKLGEYKCIFKRKIQEWKIGPNNEIEYLKVSEVFELINDDQERFMINEIEWRPVDE